MIKNKNFIFIILILFLIVSSNFVYAGEEKYNKKLLNEFENKNWILVTVTLRDISNLDYLNVKTKYEKLQIYKNKKTLNKKSQDKIISMLSESDFKIKSVSIAGRGFNGEITKEGLAKLEVNPNVLKIYKPIYGSGLLDDSVSLINVSSNVWDLGYTGKGKTICVIDSGIDNTHSGLNGQIKAEHCFCTVSDYGSGGCCPDNTGNDALATDDYGHGTHVSGIIASKDPTYKGVAYDSKLVVVKALDNNNRWIGPDITNAIDWCVTNKDVYDISIISMSLGSDGLFTNPDDCDSIPSGEAITAAYNAGIFVVAASGNNGNENGITHPACVSRATSVGATEKDDTMWSNTNRVGGLLDLLAPGEDINSLNWGGGCIPGCSCFGDYMNCDGTSMAAPHVAGAAALLLELDDSLTPDLIKTLLRNTGVMIDGYPRIDVLAAIQSISTLEDSEILTITNIGNDELKVNGINSNLSWVKNINETSFTLQGGESRQINITINVNGVSSGTHNGHIVISSNDPDPADNELYVPITLNYNRPEVFSSTMIFNFTVAGTTTNYVRVPKNATIVGATASIREVY